MDPKAAAVAAAIAREQRSIALLRQTAQEVQQLRDELEQGELVAARRGSIVSTAAHAWLEF